MSWTSSEPLLNVQFTSCVYGVEFYLYSLSVTPKNLRCKFTKDGCLGMCNNYEISFYRKNGYIFRGRHKKTILG